MTRDFGLPSPNTVWVPSFQRSHAWQFVAADCSFWTVGFSGTNGAAVSCGRFVMIFCLRLTYRTVVRYNEVISGVIDAIGNPSSRLRAIALALRARPLRVRT